MGYRTQARHHLCEASFVWPLLTGLWNFFALVRKEICKVTIGMSRACGQLLLGSFVIRRHLLHTSTHWTLPSILLRDGYQISRPGYYLQALVTAKIHKLYQVLYVIQLNRRILHVQSLFFQRLITEGFHLEFCNRITLRLTI